MTFSCSKGVRREKRNFKPFNVKKNLHVTVKENIPFGGKEMEDINMVNNDVMLCEKDEFLTITVEKYSFSSEVLVPDEISCDDLPDLLSHDDIDFEDFGFWSVNMELLSFRLWFQTFENQVCDLTFSTFSIIWDLSSRCDVLIVFYFIHKISWCNILKVFLFMYKISRRIGV